MNRYTTSIDSTSIEAADVEDAVEIIARRMFGSRGVCATLRHAGHSPDRRCYTYEAFVGVNEHNGTNGQNVFIYEHGDCLPPYSPWLVWRGPTARGWRMAAVRGRQR